jgi:cytochrome c
MNKYRLNQIAMAVLGALLLFFGARTIVNIAFEKPEAEKPGYEVAKPGAKPGGEAAKPAGESEAELDALLAKADPAKGAEVAKKCQICHNFDKGGPNLIGPNLYGVLGRDVASHEGFDYSPALKAKGGKWDYASINAMITNPGAYVPGTKMALFPGLPDAQQRADVLAFLRTKNDNPPPLPAAGAAPAAPATAPAGEAAKPEAPAPSTETPPAPSTETPPAPSTETPPAPSAETPPAPSAETPPAPPPAAETPQAPPPAAETPAPSAETPAPSAEPAAPEAAPSAETPAPSAETPAPSAETPPSNAAVDASQPQPVYPNGPPSD